MMGSIFGNVMQDDIKVKGLFMFDKIFFLRDGRIRSFCLSVNFLCRVGFKKKKLEVCSRRESSFSSENIYFS